MARSQQTFGKKEREKQKQKKKLEKEKRKEERKANSAKGIDDMIAYVDEYGNILDSPPDLESKEEENAEDIEVSVPKKKVKERDAIKEGVVTFFNDSKGYGFIRDKETKNQIFVHVNNANFPIKETDKVTFKIEKGPKGFVAVNVNLAD